MRIPKCGVDKGQNSLVKKTSAVENDGFIARRSTHVTGEEISSNGDTWQESLAVCEMSGKLIIRSYYTNRRTLERKWDEPPSGASRILNATETMRRMANRQLKEMQIATGYIEEGESYTGSSTKKKKKGILGLFRRSKIQHRTENNKKYEDKFSSRIHYSSDSFMGKLKRDDSRSNNYHAFNENLDPAMQRALQESLSSKPLLKSSSSPPFDCDPNNADLQRALILSSEEHQKCDEVSSAFGDNLHSQDLSISNETANIIGSHQSNIVIEDESIVLHEFSLSEEEAIAMALKLSVIEQKASISKDERKLSFENPDGYSFNDLKSKEEIKVQTYPAQILTSGQKSAEKNNSKQEMAKNYKQKHRQSHEERTAKGENRSIKKSLKKSIKKPISPARINLDEENDLQYALILSIKDLSSILPIIDSSSKEKPVKDRMFDCSNSLPAIGGIQQSTHESVVIANTLIQNGNRIKQYESEQNITAEEMAAREKRIIQKALKVSLKE